MSEVNLLKWLKHKKAEVKRNNDIFKHLKKSDKRISIALDVINQLRVGRIKAEEGTYVQMESSEFDFSGKKGTDLVEMQDVLLKTESCTACALGSIFLCTVERFNNYEMKVESIAFNENDRHWSLQEKSKEPKYVIEENKNIDYYSFSNYLTKFFTEQHLSDIENAFEERRIGHNNNVVTNYDSIKFFKTLNEYYCVNDVVIEADERAALKMRLIMENLVANKGTFNPLKNVYSRHKGRWVTPNFRNNKQLFLDRIYA